MVAEETVNETELPVWPETVVGGKFVRLLEKQVKRLRDEDPHGNRKLFLDDIFVVYLLAFFNPTVRSLRTIEDFTQTRQVQKHLSIRKLCKSTLSDYQKLADPERLRPLITALRAQLEAKGRAKIHGAKGLEELLQRTVAVDGTLLPAMADVAWAIRSTNLGHGDRLKARLDCQLNVESWLPEAIVVPEPEQSESRAAQQLIERGKIYLYDRGYSAYSLINAHYEEVGDEYQAIAHYVIRYRPAGGNSPDLREAIERELTDNDRAAHVISDRVGRFISSKNSRHHILNVSLREVILQYEQDGEVKTVRLITNLLDVPAAVIAQLYRYRWQVELFFRWLKSYGNFGHLISHSRNGVQTHFYVTLIGILLMYLHTGFRPSKYLFVLMGQVASGAASLEEVLPILRERERQSELARQSQARRRAKKQG